MIFRIFLRRNIGNKNFLFFIFYNGFSELIARRHGAINKRKSVKLYGYKIFIKHVQFCRVGTVYLILCAADGRNGNRIRKRAGFILCKALFIKLFMIVPVIRRAERYANKRIAISLRG